MITVQIDSKCTMSTKNVKSKKKVVFFFCERNKLMFFQFLSEGRQMTLECLYFTLFPTTTYVFCLYPLRRFLHWQKNKTKIKKYVKLFKPKIGVFKVPLQKRTYFKITVVYCHKTQKGQHTQAQNDGKLQSYFWPLKSLQKNFLSIDYEMKFIIIILLLF